MSIWADLQDRCSGEVVREEDSVDRLDPEVFFEHIESTYEYVNPSMMGIQMLYMGNGKCTIPILYNNKYCYCIHYDQNNSTIDFMERSLKPFPEISKSLKKKFRCHTTTEDYVPVFISPKDGSEVTNQFFLDVLDFIIETGGDKVLIKKKEL